MMRVCIIDVFYSLTSNRIILDEDLLEFNSYTQIKSWLGKVTDVMDFVTALTILYLFRHYLRKIHLE
jgi:hypothetical protein